MGERRKRRSLWDKESEMTHFSGTYENNYWAGKVQHSSHYSGQYREFSASESYRALNFRDKSTEEKPVDPMNGSFNRSRESAPEWKEIGGENKYYQKISPEFKYSHSLGNDRSHSQRYTGRRRSRSRSRSRSRGRSRSRSLSRGRERERVRGWNRADHDHISRHSYSSRGSQSELRDNNSDPYQGEDEQFQNRNRGAFPCKDFIKGKCRWGDTCRFSHHFASGGTFGKGTRFLSSDKDNEQQPYKNGTLCKYFAAGKCDLNNCRFSHEDLRFNGLEGREGTVTNDDSFYNKGNKRDGPKWIGTTRTTDDVKPSGWNESIVTVKNNNGDDTNERNGSRWNHSLENENVKWPIQGRNDDSIDWNNRPSPHARSGTYSGELGTGESIVKETMADKQAVLMLHGSQLQNHDGNLNVEGLNRSEVDQQFPTETWHTVSQVSHIQHQAHGIIENKSVSSFKSDVLDGVSETKNAAYPIPVSRQNLSESGETHSIPNITESGPYPNPSNLIADLNLQQSQMQNHQNAMQMTQSLETRVPHIFPNLARNEHSVEFPNPLVSLIGQQVPLIETNISLSHDPINPMEDDSGANEHVNHTEQGKQMQVERPSPSTNVGVGPGNSKSDHSERSRLEQETVLTNAEAGEGKRAIGKESKGLKSNKDSETLESHGKAEESNANKDDKGMRLFKNSLIEFVKDILKPTWKEGQMSREVHKTIVKKVVDKVTSTIQVNHIPKTQEKVEQYLSFSKPKIAKLVQAYVGRCLKTDS